MLSTLNQKSQSGYRDNIIAKNIIDIIFVNTETNIKNDNKISGFMKGLVLGQLPKVINYSKEHIDKMNQYDVKKLLDSIQNELSKRN